MSAHRRDGAGGAGDGGARDASAGGAGGEGAEGIAALDADPARAWLLDLDGTLYHALPVKAWMAAELALLGVRQAPLLRRFRLEHELLRHAISMPARSRARPGEASPGPPPRGAPAPLAPGAGVDDPFAEQVARTARALGTDPAHVERVVRAWMVERPARRLRRWRRAPLIAAWERAVERGLPTAVVSDYPARTKLAGLGVAHLARVVVASGEPGGPARLKPDPDGYLRAARALGVAPAACLVIGDRDDADGAAARAAGMRFLRV